RWPPAPAGSGPRSLCYRCSLPGLAGFAARRDREAGAGCHGTCGAYDGGWRRFVQAKKICSESLRYTPSLVPCPAGTSLCGRSTAPLSRPGNFVEPAFESRVRTCVLLFKLPKNTGPKRAPYFLAIGGESRIVRPHPWGLPASRARLRRSKFAPGKLVEPRLIYASRVRIPHTFCECQSKRGLEGPFCFGNWRRERDSNPRYDVSRIHAFQACSLDRSDTSPETENHTTFARAGGKR